MSLTHTNYSFSSSHNHNDFEYQSGSPSNGRTLLTTISLNSVLSYVFWFFTTIFPHSHGHSQGGSGAEGSRDVESGGVIQLQGAAAAEPSNGFVVPPPPLVGVGGSTQVAETIMGNQTVIMEVESGTGPPRYVSEETGTHPNCQIIGQHVVGIWVVPTVVGVISGLIQVAVGSQKAKSDEKLLLYLSFGTSLATSIMVEILRGEEQCNCKLLNPIHLKIDVVRIPPGMLFQSLVVAYDLQRLSWESKLYWRQH